MLPTLETLRTRLIDNIDFDSTPGHWIWTGAVQTGGYGQVWDGTKQITTHRLAFEILGKEQQVLYPGEMVLHAVGCPSKLCINPICLRRGDHRSNMADAKASGAMNRPRRKRIPISEAELKDIRESYAAGETRNSIAIRLNRKHSLIDKVVKGLIHGTNGRFAIKAAKAVQKRMKIEIRWIIRKNPDLIYICDLPEYEPAPFFPTEEEFHDFREVWAAR
jgi:hypothetical protein